MQVAPHTSDTYFKQLDGLRFFAVLAILGVHWVKFSTLPQIQYIAADFAIDLFFVLSGFLISRSLLIDKIAIERGHKNKLTTLILFYIRRVLRIFPIYYLFITACVCFNVSNSREIYPWLFTFTTNFFNLNNELPSIFNHLWTLAIEEQFYLLFPFFVLWIPMRLMKPFFYGGILLAIVSRIIALYYFNLPKAAFLFPFCCSDAFSVGALIAYYLVMEKSLETILSKRYILYLSGGLFIICCYRFIFIGAEDALALSIFRLCISGLCLWIVCNCLSNKQTGIVYWVLESRIIRYIGKVGYGVYLYHVMAPIITNYLIQQLDLFSTMHFARSFIILLMNFLITLVIASLSWYLIETPIQHFKKRFVSAT